VTWHSSQCFTQALWDKLKTGKLTKLQLKFTWGEIFIKLAPVLGRINQKVLELSQNETSFVISTFTMEKFRSKCYIIFLRKFAHFFVRCSIL
jgi:hypothetical protein